MEYFSSSDATKVAQIDAPFVSTHNNYAQKNAYQYYLVMNTWCNLCYDISSCQAADILAFRIKSHGLIDTIKTFDNDALHILQDSIDLMSDAAKAIVGNVPMRKALQILRYPKRFSPFLNDITAKAGITNFLAVNNAVKMRDRNGYNHYTLPILRSVISGILGEAPSITEIEDKGYFSSGTVAFGDACLAHKIQDWDFPSYCGYPLSTKTYPAYYADHEFSRGAKTAQVQAVPKSYKTPRIIAKEQSTRQYFEQGLRSIIEERISTSYIGQFIKLDNQGVNQLRCFLGSTVDSIASYSTIDLSHASDSISWAFAADIIPQPWYQLIREYRSSNMDVDGKLVTCYMLATSGSALCFALESLIFFAIAYAAWIECNSFNDTTMLPPYTYGDDMIVDSRCYDTTCDLLHFYGFTVNEDKSFTYPSHYRESCGVEFLDGEEMSTCYWPRKSISKSDSSYESLVSLHNRLYFISWSCHMTLFNAIHDLVGDRFTCSNVDDYIESETSDPINVFEECKEKWTTAHGDPIPTEVGPIKLHLASRTVPRGKRVRVPDVYYYVQYLQHGPMYEDDLMEILHVSTSRRSASDSYADSAVILTHMP